MLNINQNNQTSKNKILNACLSSNMNLLSMNGMGSSMNTMGMMSMGGMSSFSGQSNNITAIMISFMMNSVMTLLQQLQTQLQERKGDMAALDYIKQQGGGWVFQHGQYQKNGNTYISKANNALQGYGLNHQGGGNYNVLNPNGEVIGQWKNPTGTDKVASPIAFDMNSDGKIGVTGQTTAQVGTRTELGQTVNFDINADGKLDTIEWMKGDGDALLVDDRDGQAARQMDGSRLFGDQGGQFTDGYSKLAKLDQNNDGKLTGQELNGLKLWFDNGDAKVDQGEFVDIASKGITEISVKRADVTNERGETLMQSSATMNGKQILTEDVWFGQTK